MAKTRLDVALVERGLAETRAAAQRLVMAGLVFSGERRLDKPGHAVAADAPIEVRGQPHPYVSRGGLKLEKGLDHFAIPVTGRIALDVGASTGGFTDCLLQRGAAHVVALDVAYGELHWQIRTDERVTVLERANARRLERDQLPYAPDLVVADVSFISLTKILPAVLATTAARFDALMMVKPQFEVGRERVGKGGVVRGADDRRSALVDIGEWGAQNGHAVLGYASSGLPGPAGNRESFIWIAEAGRAGAVESIEKAAREVEP
jgi:23S rRNA (cytidine1920-2'-O)/16S rRNA (cytidine1409-2'-O)-methyltransferase